LPDHSIDFITAGQAFHWFDAARARKEFGRILRAPLREGIGGMLQADSLLGASHGGSATR